MLKYIHLILSESYNQKISKYLPTMRDDLRKHEVFLLVNDSAALSKEETLFVTDQEVVVKELQHKNAYVVALLHENNRQQNLSITAYVIENLEQLEYESFDEIYRRLAGLPWEILQTERMTVRESTVEDVRDFYRIYSHPSITRYMENLFPKSEQEQAYMEDYIRQIYGFYGYGLWTILLKQTGEIIGRAGLNVRAGYETPELGFVIDHIFQRKGYAYEVCSAILHYANTDLCFHQVHALVDNRNTAAVHLLQKLGFVFEKEVWEQNQPYHKYLLTFSE